MQAYFNLKFKRILIEFEHLALPLIYMYLLKSCYISLQTNCSTVALIYREMILLTISNEHRTVYMRRVKC